MATLMSRARHSISDKSCPKNPPASSDGLITAAQRPSGAARITDSFSANQCKMGVVTSPERTLGADVRRSRAVRAKQKRKIAAAVDG